jgi:hypothetical protein
MKKSKKFEEKRNDVKKKNSKNKVDNMENIMKEFNDNLEKDNDIQLSAIDNSNSNHIKKISSKLVNDEQVLFNHHSDNEIESKKRLI